MLQGQLEELQESQSDRQSRALDRTNRLLKQIQQESRLQDLERRLRQLQSGGVTAKGQPAKTNPSIVSQTSTPTAGGRKAVLKASPTQAGSERFSLQIQNADITEVLEMLSQTAGLNILAGAGVSGTVPSANLQDVTVEQALGAILRSLGLAYEREEDFIFVMTEAEQKAANSSPGN